MGAVLLCYNLSSEKAGKIRLAAMRWKARMRIVQPWELTQPISELLSSQAPSEGTISGDVFQDEMLVLCRFPAPAASGFLDMIRHQGTPVALKAMLTSSNAKWSSIQLHEELSKEWAALDRGEVPVHKS